VESERSPAVGHAFVRPPPRRPSQSVEVGPFIATVSFDPQTKAPIEVFFTARAKSGTDIDELLYEMGVSISKVMQDGR